METERSDSTPGTAATAASIGDATCSATSAVPAPGYGAITVTIGKSMFGSSSCFRFPQLATPPPNTARAIRMVTLRRATASFVRKNTETSSGFVRLRGSGAVPTSIADACRMRSG